MSKSETSELPCPNAKILQLLLTIFQNPDPYYAWIKTYLYQKLKYYTVHTCCVEVSWNFKILSIYYLETKSQKQDILKQSRKDFTLVDLSILWLIIIFNIISNTEFNIIWTICNTHNFCAQLTNAKSELAKIWINDCWLLRVHNEIWKTLEGEGFSLWH